MLLSQNLILMGIFFTVPLFLQVVQGLDAPETGVRMLPASVGLFVAALAGSALARRFSARAVGEEARSEAGGLQYTAQQLGSSLGTASLGAVVITGLLTSFTANVEANPKLDPGVEREVGVRLSSGGSFVPAAEVEAAATAEGYDQASTAELVGDYEDAQLSALKIAFLFAAGLVLAALFTTRNLPAKRLEE
jgi:hypothetical protein